MRRGLAIAGYATLVVGIFGMVLSSFPALLALQISQEQSPDTIEQFPVTVNPKNKTITENDAVNTFFESDQNPFQAAIGTTKYTLANLFEWIAITINDAPWYRALAAIDSQKIIAVTPGMRKEQVSDTFARTLAWSVAQKKEFGQNNPSLLPHEGSFAPGVYAFSPDTTPSEARDMLHKRFSNTILARYGTTVAEIVPLEQALTIASLIEREAGGKYDMRMISGIIWNRLFLGMNLQIDATIQYAKANSSQNGSWWPKVTPQDTSLRSPYNTYLHPGLPPAPIANPSVAAVFAALNPKKTTCLFYFHDASKQFHCSDTYREHVTLLKKYYGQGK